jgi:hypothetical protein
MTSSGICLLPTSGDRLHLSLSGAEPLGLVDGSAHREGMITGARSPLAGDRGLGVGSRTSCGVSPVRSSAPRPAPPRWRHSSVSGRISSCHPVVDTDLVTRSPAGTLLTGLPVPSRRSGAARPRGRPWAALDATASDVPELRPRSAAWWPPGGRRDGTPPSC